MRKFYVEREKTPPNPMGLPIQTNLDLQLLTLAIALPNTRFSGFTSFKRRDSLKNTDFTSVPRQKLSTGATLKGSL